MIVEIDPTSPVPAYEQLRRQVASMVVAGSIGTDERLPSIRQLAADLDLAPGTVQRAYRELEAAGLVIGAGRRGTRVAPRAAWRVDGDVESRLDEAARRFARTARQLGASPERAARAVAEALEAIAQV